MDINFHGEAVWLATNRCHLKCRYCCESSGSKAKTDELSTREAKELVKMVSQLEPRPKLFDILGGEPMLRPDLLDIVGYASSLGVTSCVMTKGTLINETWVREMASKRAEVSISMDALNPELYDWIVQRDGLFPRAVQATKICQEAGILMGMSCILIKQNKAETFKMVDLSKELKAGGLWIAPLRPTGRGRDVFDAFAIVGQEYEDYLEEMYHYIDRTLPESHDRFFVSDPLYNRVLYRHGHDLTRLYTWTGKLCGIGYFLCIDSEGFVRPCFYSNLVVGNIREKPLAQIRKEMQSLPFCKALHEPEKLKGPCHDCQYNHVCGGCRVRAYGLTGDWLESDPVCGLASAENESQTKRLEPVCATATTSI